MAIENCVCCQGETGDACDGANPPKCRGVTISTSLTATVTGTSGTCSCYGSTFELVYNASLNRWISTVQVCTDTDPIFVSVYCENGHWVIDAGGFEISQSITATCTPVQFTFQYAHNDSVCVGTVSITVVETPP